MRFKNEMMGFIQLGKAVDKLLNKSGKGHKGLEVRQGSLAWGSQDAVAAKLTPKRNESMPGIVRWSTGVQGFTFRLTAVLGGA